MEGWKGQKEQIDYEWSGFQERAWTPLSENLRCGWGVRHLGTPTLHCFFRTQETNGSKTCTQMHWVGCPKAQAHSRSPHEFTRDDEGGLISPYQASELAQGMVI